MNPEESSTAEERLAEALSSNRPATSALALARKLKTEGMTQKTMYELFDRFRSKHENDEVETKYDAILDTMDFIVGYCNRASALFDTTLET